MSVPLVRWNFDISILLGLVIIFSFSAYSFIKVSKSSLLTTVFLNNGDNLRNNDADVRELQYHIEHNQRVAHRYFLARVVLHSKDVCRESFPGVDFWLLHRFFRVSTTHTPTFQQFGIPFVVCNPYASHLAVVSSFLSQYRYLLGRDVLLDRDSSDSNTP